MAIEYGNLNNRDWSTGRASRIDNGAIGSGETKETHVRSDGTYVIVKKNGEIISVRKVS